MVKITSHNKEFHDIYSLPNISLMNSRRMRWARHGVGRGRKTSTQGYVRKCEGKGPLERPRQRWKDNIKINFKKKAQKVIHCIHLFRDKWWAFVNTVMNFGFQKMWRTS